MTLSNKFPRIAARVFGVTAILTGIYLFIYENRVVFSPKLPQPLTGEVVRYPFKGLIFYVTAADELHFRIAHYVFFSCVVLGLLIGIAQKICTKKSEP